MLEIALGKLELSPGYWPEGQLKGGEEDSGPEIQVTPMPGDLVIFQPTKTSSSWSLKTPPSIFAKILAMDVEKPSSHDLSENALLAHAGAFVPEVSKSENKKKKLAAPGQKSKTLKVVKKEVVKKEKAESSAKDMAKKNARKKASPKNPSKEQGLLTLAEIPEDVSSFKFECPTYGSCKLEMYSEKSYIRQWWRLILGSCDKTYHRQLCRRLVPEVQRGKNAADLKMIREKFLDDLKDVD